MAAFRLAYLGLAAMAAAGAGLLVAYNGPRSASPNMDIDRTTTAVIAPSSQDAPLVNAAGLERLTEGLSALRSGRIGAALQVRDAFPAGSLDRHILSWAVALYGGDGVASTEIARTARELSDWPGAEDLQRTLERSLFAETPAPEVVRKLFESRTPLTHEGAIVLARAKLATGDREGARNALASVWRSEKMSLRDEMIVLKEFPDVLTEQDHRIRMEQMLYEEDVPAATRVMTLARAEPLLKAWSAVLGNAASAQKLLDAVPGELRSPGYSFVKIKALRKAKRLSAAAGLMLDVPDDADALIDPNAWWLERRILARNLFEAGKAKTAYKLVAGHGAQTPGDRADAEFAAGWYALRGLNDPAAAERHFARIEAIAAGAITRARAYYWLGRATEAAGDAGANRHYEAAARYGTTFYGQLAAARIGSPALDLRAPSITEQDRKRFSSREAVQAIDRLSAAGQSRYTARLYLDLAQQIESPGEIALLAAQAERDGNHFIALKVAKAAAQRGLHIGTLSHPIGVIPDSADVAGAGKALAYAIARQESEFNVGAVSGAGALGLLQLMPGTAQETARKTGLAYSQERLTADPGYNATLGAAVLNQQLQRFDGSYVLTFAAYNAGPRRVNQWIARYGDPRGQSLDEVVDWIEQIPFSETRAYVQRVMENYEVYKMRLSGHYDIVSDLTNGRTTSAAAN